MGFKEHAVQRQPEENTSSTAEKSKKSLVNCSQQASERNANDSVRADVKMEIRNIPIKLEEEPF